MKARRINANKPHRWKADIAASVDQFNEWFMRFAPEAFRSTRVETTEHVKAALLATDDLRELNAATLKANPGALPTLRMCTAPPLAVDRLVGLADASKNLVGRMEKGKLPTKMQAVDLDEQLTKLCRILSRLLDWDIFPSETYTHKWGQVLQSHIVVMQRPDPITDDPTTLGARCSGTERSEADEETGSERSVRAMTEPI